VTSGLGHARNRNSTVSNSIVMSIGDLARILIEVAGVIVGAIEGEDRDKRDCGSRDIQSVE
jgi:hypothetical protein